jgi:Flp pilus assembly protein TadG
MKVVRAVNGLKRFFGREGEGGQAIVLIALMMSVMLMIVGVAVDAGQLYSAKRTQQEAADAAAFAGGVVIYQGGTPTQARLAAIADATRNGYTDGINNVIVTVNAPPVAGPFINNNKYVEVIITAQVRTSLTPAQALLNPVKARGVGGADPVKSPFAVVMLKQTGPCFTTQGTGSISVPSGPDLGGMIQANCSGQSMNFQGSGNVTDLLGTRTVGTVSNPAKIVGGLTQGASKIADPFAAFPKPPVTNVVSNSQYNVPASACNQLTPLTPGTYVGGIVNSQNCNVYFGNGIFILKGGGLNQNANSGNLNTLPGGGAMIFNTHSAYPGAPGSCGSISAQQGGGFNLTAIPVAVDPIYGGMSFYQDAACTNAIAIQSQGGYNFTGTFYAPTATLALTSQANMTLNAQLVVSAIDFQANGNLTINYEPSTSANSGLPTVVE